MHGSKWRREETSVSRLRRAARAPPADPTRPVLAPHRLRLYHAIAGELFILTGTDERLPVVIG
jgi:hypothetical protein